MSRFSVLISDAVRRKETKEQLYWDSADLRLDNTLPFLLKDAKGWNSGGCAEHLDLFDKLNFGQIDKLRCIYNLLLSPSF